MENGTCRHAGTPGAGRRVQWQRLHTLTQPLNLEIYNFLPTQTHLFELLTQSAINVMLTDPTGKQLSILFLRKCINKFESFFSSSFFPLVKEQKARQEHYILSAL